MRVGVLTGGGDAPGLNAAICGLARRMLAGGAELLGFRAGWRGLIANEVVSLADENFQHLLAKGGSLLGSSGESPYARPDRDVPRVQQTFADQRLDALVVIGGEGTLGTA